MGDGLSKHDSTEEAFKHAMKNDDTMKEEHYTPDGEEQYETYEYTQMRINDDLLKDFFDDGFSINFNSDKIENFHAFTGMVAGTLIVSIQPLILLAGVLGLFGYKFYKASKGRPILRKVEVEGREKQEVVKGDEE